MVTKLDLYKVFCQVGKSKSFSRAAEQLYMTQPAVSQAIRQMETELGIRLFNRNSKGVSFTDEGGLLYEYANSALNLLQVGEEKIEEFKDLSAGELRIGVGDTISRHFLLPYLEAFHNNYPNIKFKIVNGTTMELCATLKSGEVDLAICNLPLVDDALEVRSWIDVQDVFVCGEKYKRKLDTPLSLSDLVKVPLILLEPNSNSRNYVENFLQSQGVYIEPEFELGSHDLLLEFASINLGLACVTKEFSQQYITDGKLFEVDLATPIPKRSIGVCFLKSVPLSTASNKFVEIIEKQTNH